MDVEFSPLDTSSQYQIISNNIELIEVEGSFSRYKSAICGYTTFVNNFFSGDMVLHNSAHYSFSIELFNVDNVGNQPIRPLPIKSYTFSKYYCLALLHFWSVSSLISFRWYK